MSRGSRQIYYQLSRANSELQSQPAQSDGPVEEAEDSLCRHPEEHGDGPPVRVRRLEVKTKITSFQENCIYAIGPQMRSLKDQQVRELQLPRNLTEKLIEYKRKDQQYYHCENQLTEI